MFTSLSERVSGGSSLSLENTYHVQTNHETIGYLETFLSIGKGCLFWQLNKSIKKQNSCFYVFCLFWCCGYFSIRVGREVGDGYY